MKSKEERMMTKAQIEILKTKIDEMSRSDEQFVFMLFKNANGKSKWKME